MAGGPIEIVGLRKQFKDFVAVNDLTLSVKKNSFTGFLGPNGAGKSTTLKILTNLIRASSGSAYLIYIFLFSLLYCCEFLIHQR